MNLNLKSNTQIGDYKIMFHSFMDERPISTPAAEIVRGTKCTIKRKGDLVIEADVRRMHKDVDNKIKARQFAFRKAILSLDEENRKNINSAIGSIDDNDVKIEIFNFLKEGEESQE